MIPFPSDVIDFDKLGITMDKITHPLLAWLGVAIMCAFVMLIAFVVLASLYFVVQERMQKSARKKLKNNKPYDICKKQPRA